jgi:Flp pilus assembly protein TadG
MRAAGRDRQRGVAMVEFGLAMPFLLLIVFGMVDFGRAIDANTTVADAARQGARQMAPNAASSDGPFGTYSGTCSGTAFSQNATGTGCLTDAAVFATVSSVLAPLTRNVVQNSNTLAASCPSPAVGQAEVCIAPSETGAATRGPNDTCAAAQLVLLHLPAAGDLGGRKAEWTTPQYASGRCFLVQVTVRYGFSPWTPVITRVIGSSIVVASTSSTVAEY